MNTMVPLTTPLALQRYVWTLFRHVYVHKDMFSHFAYTSRHYIDMQTPLDVSRDVVSLSGHI